MESELLEPNGFMTVQVQFPPQVKQTEQRQVLVLSLDPLLWPKAKTGSSVFI